MEKTPEMANGDTTYLRQRHTGKKSKYSPKSKKKRTEAKAGGDLSPKIEKQKLKCNIQTETKNVSESENEYHQQKIQPDFEADIPAHYVVEQTWCEKLFEILHNFMFHNSRKTGFYRIHPTKAKELYYDIVREQEEGRRDAFEQRVNEERKKRRGESFQEEKTRSDFEIEENRRFEKFFIFMTGLVIVTCYPFALYVALTKQTH
uniref:uncharacterized protein LOC104266361 n=1 Tax=Ciona intestinalis TaxID=7719 RepID=UPI00089DD5FE|nr:uncharacterized protein LOC104266361 [Ciona intestinalis]|eukprot:XP_009860633.2 uncharacterized protein LOC104266361 [Ciona intestinalis]